MCECVFRARKLLIIRGRMICLRYHYDDGAEFESIDTRVVLKRVNARRGVGERESVCVIVMHSRCAENTRK